MTPPPIVLVTGVPGAGKSTLAGQLAQSMGAALLSLDTIKEALYAQGAHRQDRHALRLAAERELARQLAAKSLFAVVDIWVAPGRDEQRTAVWVGLLGRPVVEVLCRVPAEVATARYRSRRRGGPHLPADEDMVRRIEAAAVAIVPLGLGTTIEVETVDAVDVDHVVAQIAAALDPDKSDRP